MPDWLIVVLVVGGYVGMALVTAMILSEKGDDVSDSWFRLFLGMLWPVVLPGAGLVKIVHAYVKSKEQAEEERRKLEEQWQNWQKRSLWMDEEQAAELVELRKKVKSLQEANKNLAELYNTQITQR